AQALGLAALGVDPEGPVELLVQGQGVVLGLTGGSRLAASLLAGWEVASLAHVVTLPCRAAFVKGRLETRLDAVLRGLPTDDAPVGFPLRPLAGLRIADHLHDAVDVPVDPVGELREDGAGSLLGVREGVRVL